MPLELYNTLTRGQEPLTPADPAHVTFYTCGPTVYDDAHIGNFRSFLAADLLRRFLESPLCTLSDASGAPHTGPRAVTHVMNITDVGHMTDDDDADGGGEDKMEAASKRLAEQQAAAGGQPSAKKHESKKSGTAHASLGSIDPRDPRQIAAFYAERFVEDARRLGLKVAIESEADPTVMPRASERIDQMKAMIESLAERGYAYRAGDAVYFDVQRFPSYGALSGNSLDALKGGAGGRVSDEHQSEKHHPADFLLWKSDPSHLMKWPGPKINGEQMPEGYPGWHIECSAMARERLGDELDLHSGGEDNIFPHHECERAQSCCTTGSDTFARHWFHPRFLMVEGEKMSKSKGNFFTARDLFDKGHEPAAVRLELLKTHYRANANFTEQGLKDGARVIERWRQFIARTDAKADPATTADARRTAQAGFVRAMEDDLNVAGALGSINSFITAVPTPSEQDASLLRNFDAVLGLLELERPAAEETSIGLFAAGLDPDPRVIELLELRRDARKSKDFAAADAIRNELTALGFAIKDAPGGKVEVSRA
ncbi:MAG: cysteine--tRNA ligase [Planctomycetota bacterium]